MRLILHIWIHIYLLFDQYTVIHKNQMEKLFRTLIFFFACISFSCQMVEFVDTNEHMGQPVKTVSLVADICSLDTKASLDSQTGAFSWQTGDIISVLATDGKFYDFVLEDGNAERIADFTGVIPETSEVTTVAVYPGMVENGADAAEFLSGNTLGYVLPNEWDYSEDVSNVPMVASFETGASHMSFKQVGGVMRFPVKNLPQKATFVLTMNDKTVTGQFPIDITALGEAAIKAGSEPSVLTINYASEVDGGSADFNVPVPVGVYNNFKVEIKDASDKVLISKNYCADNKVNRSTLLIMKELVLPARPSSLAKVYITTPDGVGITSKTTWVEGANIRIVDEKGKEDLNVSTSIRGRGNTTWSYPKKPYALKLDKKAKVLGMPKHKRWVLLANWMDRTLMRNDVAFEIARRIMEWAPRGQFVEVYLNGVHQGNYYLCEQIKVDENRVNVGKLDEDSDFTDPEILTGGYILEFDEYGQFDEPNFFWSKVVDTDDGTPIAIKEPDEEVITSHSHPGFLYIQDYIYKIEDLFEADKADLARWNEIEELIDVTSYIDYWFIHELTTNLEPNQPRSCYMYKKRGGKLYAGPIWDFDYRTFNPDYKYFNIKSTMWYVYLFKYPEFKSAVRLRWNELEETFKAIDQYIVETAEKVRESNEVNIGMWPISGTVNGDEGLTYEDAIERMRAAYKYRIERVGTNVSYL